MSFESGRKLSLVGSIIQVIMPVIIVITLVLFIISLFASMVTNNGLNPFSIFSSTYLVLLLILIASGIVTLLGLILFLVGMQRLSRHYNDNSIFTSALYGFILNLIGSGASTAIYLVISLTGGFSTNSSTTVANTTVASGTQVIVAELAVFFVTFVLGVMSAVFYQRSFNHLAERSGKNNFKTVGLLYLLGEVLTIILVGPLLIWIAWIMAATEFNSLKPTELPPPTFNYTAYPYPPPPPPT